MDHLHRATQGLLVILFFVAVPASAAESGKARIVIEEQRIEGKIRRPQMVLIRADQRPTFSPMVSQTLGNAGSIVEFVDQSLLEKSPYDGAFKFEGTRIINYVP